MALVSMKTGNEDNEYAEISENPYGYGLCLRLNPEQCKALGIDTPPKAGTAMMLMAKSIVARSTEEADIEEEGEAPETEVYLELQITDLEVRAASDGTASAATVLYGA